MPAVFAYWNFRGLGHSIRLLMAHAGDDAVEKFYVQTAKGGMTPAEIAPEWFEKDKQSLGFDFPNLPYYIDGEVKITESRAIMRYLGRKHKLDGSTEQDKISIDVVSEVCADFHKNLIGLCYDPEFAGKTAQFSTDAAEKFALLETFLSEKPYFIGTAISWLDFYAYEVLYQHRMFWPDILKRLPKLAAFMKRIEALPKIRAYMSSDRYRDGPICGVTAVNRGGSKL